MRIYDAKAGRYVYCADEDCPGRACYQVVRDDVNWHAVKHPGMRRSHNRRWVCGTREKSGCPEDAFNTAPSAETNNNQSGATGAA